MNRRKTIQLVSASLALPTALAPLGGFASAQVAMATAINRAARFRALSQRTAKAYAQWHLGVLPDAAQQVLRTADNLMRAGADDLTKANLQGDSQRLFAQLSSQVASLRTAVAVPPSKDSVLAAAQVADRKLKVADDLTQALQAQSKQGSARLINLAGRQRMLSQRMAKSYFLAAVGAPAKPLRDQISADRADFKAALDTLNASPISTPAIRNDMAQLQAQWLFFDMALDKPTDAQTLQNMATTSERVLEMANALTEKYEIALLEVLGSTS